MRRIDRPITFSRSLLPMPSCPISSRQTHGGTPMIDLHYWATPNGKKATILLEECGMAYKIVPVNIGRGDQFSAEFLEMNPNHRMPVMVDREPKGGGKPIVVFESGAIMMYIAEKAGKFYPQELRARSEGSELLIWQMANPGPKSGDGGHLRRVDHAK